MPAGSEPGVVAPIRILLVDDHTIVRQGVRMLLESEPDLTVCGEASGGEEAIKLTEALDPDVVVMDISMPGMSGIVATHRIRQRDPTARVLILTMHDRREYVLDMLDAGACGYILKETAAEQLAQAVRSVVRGESVFYPTIAPSADAPRPEGRLPLTVREREVVTLIARGLTNQRIAEALNVSLKTVQAHRSHIMEKLDLHDRVEIAKYALRHGLCEL